MAPLHFRAIFPKKAKIISAGILHIKFWETISESNTVGIMKLSWIFVDQPPAWTWEVWAADYEFRYRIRHNERPGALRNCTNGFLSKFWTFWYQACQNRKKNSDSMPFGAKITIFHPILTYLVTKCSEFGEEFNPTTQRGRSLREGRLLCRIRYCMHVADGFITT